VVNRSQHAPRHIELLDFAKDTVAAYPNGTSLGNSAHIDALMENLQFNLQSPGNQHAKPFVWTKAEVYRFLLPLLAGIQGDTVSVLVLSLPAVMRLKDLVA
jgi:hypothetical protein